MCVLAEECPCLLSEEHRGNRDCPNTLLFAVCVCACVCVSKKRVAGTWIGGVYT